MGDEELEVICNKLIEAAKLLDGTLIIEDEKEAVFKKHMSLKNMAAGEIYFKLAKKLVDELESKLVFTGPIPYPQLSDMIGIKDQEMAFLDGGPLVVMAFPNWGGAHGAINIDYSRTGGSDYVQPKRLTKRMYDDIMIVDNYESFVEFIKKAVSGFRNANPFVPMQGEVFPGELVYCIRYGDTAQPVSIKDLGNTIPFEERLGFVTKTNGFDGCEIKTFADYSRDEKRTFWYKFGDFGRAEAEGRRRNPLSIDEVHLVKKTWSKKDLERPFMTDKEVEEIVIPTIMKYAYDPRMQSVHVNKTKALSEQFSNMIEQGASADEIVEIFTNDYNVSIEQLFKIAGGDKKFLPATVLCEIGRFDAMFKEYENAAEGLIELAADCLGMTEEQFFAPVKAISLPEDGGFSSLTGSQSTRSEMDELGITEAEVNFFYAVNMRKVRGTAPFGKTIEGYAQEIFDPPYKDMVGSVNIYSDMTNPLSIDSIGYENYEGIESLGLESHKKAVNAFEIRLLYDFLQFQTHAIGMDVDGFEEKAKKAEEELKKEAKRLLRRGYMTERDEDDWGEDDKKGYTFGGHDSDSEDVSWQDSLSRKMHKRGIDLDHSIMGPLISYGMSEDEARDYVFKNCDHPAIRELVEGVIDYRKRAKKSPFRNPAAKKMLEFIRGYGEVDSMQAIHLLHTYKEIHGPFSGKDEVALYEAINIIAANRTMPGQENAVTLAPILEMEEEAVGKKREYFTPDKLANVIEGFMLEGKPSLEGAERGFKAGQGASGRVYLTGGEDHIHGIVELVLTYTEFDLKMASFILLEEIAKMNSEDPRNKDYFEAMSGISKLSEARPYRLIHNLPSVYPLQHSNYSLKADVQSGRHFFPQGDQGVYLTVEQEQTNKRIIFNDDNVKDVESAVAKMREDGMPVKIGGEHEFEKMGESKGSYWIKPEWEINSTGRENISLFNITRKVYSENRKERRDQSHRRNRLTEECYLEFDKVIAYCYHQDFFGKEWIKEVFTRTGRRIEQELNLGFQNAIDYAKSITRKGIEAPERLMIKSGDDSNNKNEED
ncbi:hypothetical protein ACFL6I_13780 [candidate division KSB1 bacterium]